MPPSFERDFVKFGIAFGYLLVGVFIAALMTNEDERDGGIVVLVLFWPILLIFVAVCYLLVGVVRFADWIKDSF